MDFTRVSNIFWTRYYQGAKIMIVKTDPRYWDCDCDNNYIHKKSITLKCEACNSEEDECSDSRPNEIKIYYKNYKEQK